jgi:predicted aspartyl protease
MIDEMGIFRTTIELARPQESVHRLVLRDVIVDTSSAYTWIPRAQLEALGATAARGERFKTADGRVLEREIGFAMLIAGGRAAPTIVVFAEEGDMMLLGAIALEGLNLRIDIVSKELVPAGPVPVATARAA